MGQMNDRIQQVSGLIQRLQQKYPTEIEAFLTFSGKTEATGALSAQAKSLINVALAVAAQCEWCIALHVQAAIHAGATQDEIIEAGFMAVMMHGGPALMYLTPLLQSLDEFLPGADPRA